MKRFFLSSSLPYVPIAKKGRDRTRTFTNMSSWIFHVFCGSSAPSISYLFNQWKHKTEISLFCATLVVIFCPSGYVGCTVRKAKGPWFQSRHRYVAGAQGVLQAVNFGMGVYFNTLHLLGRFIYCRHKSFLALQVPMARWQLPNRLTCCRASQNLWLSMACKRSESPAKINSFKNLSK